MSAASSEVPQPQRTSLATTVPLEFVVGADHRSLTLQRSPFTIGRRTDQDLVISDSRVSREHAVITAEPDGFYIIDRDSKLGTFLNGERVTRQKLHRNDQVEFGVRGGAYLVFDPEQQQHATSTAREFLSQVSGWRPTSAISDLETLSLFLEAARKLNTVGVIDEVLVTLLDATLQLTRAERGFVFLRRPDGTLRLAAGRNSKGQPLQDDSTISRSALNDAVKSGREFLVTDMDDFDMLKDRHSVVAQNLFSVICIPLRKTQIHEVAQERRAPGAGEVRGVLYLDSHFLSGKLSAVSADILRAIATEAAALVENAYLVQAEEAARRYQQELTIAASIQQRLMQVNIPDVPFASFKGKNIPCKDVGGDFFDVISTDKALNVVLADVCGKGISAALLASILQGLFYLQLVQNEPLAEIVAAANRFLCEKAIGEKYATMMVARLYPDGTLEYVNCGHVPPLLVSGGKVVRPPNSNLPVGLLRQATFESGRLQMRAGDRLLTVTDGVTEAENAAGEFFGDERLQELLGGDAALEGVMSAVTKFCAGTPLNDDCTVVELTYKG